MAADFNSVFSSCRISPQATIPEPAVNALGAFVAGGGKAIYSDWSLDGSFSAQFGAGFTGNTNLTSMTVSNPSLSAGITNPIALINPGWGNFTTGLTGTAAGTFDNSDAAIVIGNGGRSIVNGFLNDTFADGAQGVRLYENEIALLLDSGSAVPEPTSLALIACGAGVFGIVSRRRLKSANEAPPVTSV